MAVFLCRWPNGDISIVEAGNKADADFKLDEFGNADQADLYQLRNFMMDLTLGRDGDFLVKDFGEETFDQIMELAYPKLNEVFGSDDKGAIQKAVESERKRLWGSKKNLPEPKTEWAEGVQKLMGSSTVVADRLVERAAKKKLKKYRPKGKPH